MTRGEAKRLKKKLKEKFDQDMSAIDRVLELSGQKPLNGSDKPVVTVIEAPAGKATENNEDIQEGSVKLQNEIFEIISDKLTGNFKVKDVLRVVEHAKPELASRRSSISFAISALATAGKLTVIQRGRGRRPGIYCKA